MKTEMKQCVCIKCKSAQPEVLMYEEKKCSHILHAILTLLTLFWGIVWAVVYSNAKKETESNIQNAVAETKCEKCSGKLILMSN